MIIARFFLVELESGEQEFFESPYEAFHYARDQEDKRRNSVEYVACGSFYGAEDEVEGVVYKGQSLRFMLRSLDNTTSWIRTVNEVLHEQSETD